MRRCKISAGKCRKPDKPCCADCGERACMDRCENHPSRCGCCEEGPPPRRQTTKRPMHRRYDWERMAYLHAAGFSGAEIARRLGCSPKTVSAALLTMAREERDHEETS